MTFQLKTTDRQKGKNSASVVLYKGKYQTLSSIYREYEMQWITARQVFSRRDGPIPNVLFLNTQHYIAAPTLQAPLAASAVSFPWTVTEYNWVLFSSFLICINFTFCLSNLNSYVMTKVCFKVKKTKQNPHVKIRFITAHTNLLWFTFIRITVITHTDL